MDKNSFELSRRYYPAEIAVWILGAFLVLYKVPGLKPGQAIPFLNFQPENPVYIPHIISATLLVVLMYLFLEWKQSPQKAKGNLLTKSRVAITALWAGIALWLVMPTLVENTVYEGVSPAWYLGFLGSGVLLGFFAQALWLPTLMIRNPNEAKILNLPRIPYATRAQYKTWGPGLFLSLVSYFTLHFFAPNSIVHIASLITALAFLYMVLQEVAFLYMYRDNKGNRVPYKEQIARFKEIHSWHDRMCDLGVHGLKSLVDIGVSSSDLPNEAQDKIREHFSGKSKSQSFNFHVIQLDEIEIQLYLKDGNPENLAHDNCGYKIRKSQGNEDEMRVLIKPDLTEEQERELSIPISKVVKYAEKYVAAEPEKTKPDHQKVLSKAVNQTVIEILREEAGPLLPGEAMVGDIDAINLLIEQGHDVNARGEGGWTALLSSTAQGYPKIMKVLLDAGANPDISNILGITPLIYGARYGNTEAVKMLIEYGADLNLRDKVGNTALMKATECGNIEVVDILIQAGADISVKNLDKKNAIDLAYESGQGEIAKKLRNAGKKRGNQTA